MLDRTRLLRYLTTLPHERRLSIDSAGRSESARGRIVRRLLRWLHSGPVHVAGGLGDGIRLSARDFPLSHAQGALLLHGRLEPSVQEAIRERLEPAGVFYDLGANIGFWAMLAARVVGPDGRVYAFEPAPEGAAAIRANAELNDFATIEVLEKAVGSVTHTTDLVIPEDQSWAHLSDRGGHLQAAKEVSTEVVRIDDLLAAGEVTPPTVIKLDIEGSEVDALRGMEQTLRSHRPAIVCELHETNEEFVAEMERLNYCVSNLDGPEPVPEAPGDIHALAVAR